MESNVCIPFDMIVDTDYAVIRLVEETQQLKPMYDKKLKKFLVEREYENPIIEFNKLKRINIMEETYDRLIEEKYYSKLLNLATFTDMINFVIMTNDLSVSSEMRITIACNTEIEKDFLIKNMKKIQVPVNIELFRNLDLNNFDSIFTKYIDQNYIDYLLDTVKFHGAKLYVADYNFNTIIDEETGTKGILPEYHLALESEGILVFTVSLYNHLD